VQVISPDVTPKLAALAQRGAVLWTQDTVRPGLLAEAFVVFVATNDPHINVQVTQLARQHHCLVNVADDPGQCDFYMPAVVRRGHLTLAISTEGRAPGFSAWLRRQFERLLAPHLADAVARYARLRPEMKQVSPDPQALAYAWEQLLSAEAPPLFLSSSTTDVLPSLEIYVEGMRER